MSNPYEAPQFASSVTTAPPNDREKLRRVARYQQWVLYALLANILNTVLLFANALAVKSEIMATFWSLLALVIAVAAMVAIFLLAKEVYNVVVGVLCAILMVFPCISLLTLAIVNSKATAYLQQRGVKVGFMGVNPDTI